MLILDALVAFSFSDNFSVDVWLVRHVVENTVGEMVLVVVEAGTVYLIALLNKTLAVLLTIHHMFIIYNEWQFCQKIIVLLVANLQGLHRRQIMCQTRCRRNVDT